MSVFSFNCSFFSPFSSHHAGFYYTTCILSQINELNELNEKKNIKFNSQGNSQHGVEKLAEFASPISLSFQIFNEIQKFELICTVARKSQKIILTEKKNSLK